MVYAAGKVESTIAGWKEREARVGRTYTCASQSISGFPFRIEVRCDGANVDLKSHQPPVALKAKDILVSAQIWRPTVLVSEFTGPLTVGEPGQAPTVAANWRHAQSEVHGLPTAPERVVIAVEQPTVDDTAQRKRLFQATRLDLDGRIISGLGARQSGDRGGSQADRGLGAVGAPAAALPINADVTAVLTA